MDQFDQLLTCAICLDRYRNPKLLPCQHSFCMEPCMEGLVDYVRRQVKCPECRAEHRIPYQGVQAFPTNVTLQRFLELHIDLTGELPDPTANQIMERCAVCSEKQYLILCAHCDKKICTECKDAHMDVLKREISRISNQVRRILHRLEDALTLAEKNSTLLQQNSLSVMEEIDDIYRRLAKALKDRSEFMKHEVERYLQSELKTLTLFKYNMEQEFGNISSNCELVDKYVNPDSGIITSWDDSELMDTKDIFLKTMEFIRSFDYEPGDYARRLRFGMNTDPNTLVVTLGTYGDLHLPQSNPIRNSNNSHPGPGLMRSKSDHRLTTQFKEYDSDIIGSGGRTSPVFGRKFGERNKGGGINSNNSNEIEGIDIPTPTERKGRFRSRFARHLPENTFDDISSSGGGGEIGGRGVRFEEKGKERERVLDTEDVARGPLSGLVRLLDSPRVIQRVQETEGTTKLSKPTLQSIQQSPPHIERKQEIQQPTPTPTPWRATSRQLSEDDEISKQKKANKEANKTQPQPPPTPAPRRQTSTEPKITGRQNSDNSEQQQQPIPELSTNNTTTETTTTSNETTNRGPGPRKLSPERFPGKNRSESSDSGTSESSSASNASRNTGAAFTMDEIRQRFLSKSNPSSCSGGGNTTNTNTNNQNSTKPTFTSRFLGRTNTPTVEAKEEEEEEESSSSEEEDDDDESDEEVKSPDKTSRMEKTDIGPLLARSANERGNTSSNYANSKKESPPSVNSYRRTRDTGTTRLTSPNERERDGRYSSSALNTTSTTSTPNSNYGRYNTRSGGGSTDYGSGSIPRSRSTVYAPPSDDPPISTPRYSSGLANKYLNRSRHTFDDEGVGGSTSSSQRYGTGTSSYSRPSYLTKHDYATPSSSSSSSSCITPKIPQPQSPNPKNKKGGGTNTNTKVSKSKSSQDVLRDYRNLNPNPSSSSFDYELDDDGLLLNRIRRRKMSSVLPNYNNKNEEENNLSSWAKYLKNKYGKGGIMDENNELNPNQPKSGKRLSFSTHPYINKNKIIFKFGSRGSEPGKLTWPRGICTPEGPDGSVRVVVADSTNHRICVFDESGNFIKEFGSYGSGNGEFDCPASVFVNRIGQYIVSDRYNHRIQVFDPNGRFLRAFGSQGETHGKFSYPLGVTTDALNFIYVCEESRIQVFQSDGTFVGKFGSLGSKIGELSHPHYIAVTSTNKVVVSDTNNSRIQIFDVNGKVLTCFGSEGSDEGNLKSPRGVAVDESGYIIVADSGNNRIQVYSGDGVFIKSIGNWGEQEFKGLEGLACANGNIYAVDRVNHSVSVI